MNYNKYKVVLNALSQEKIDPDLCRYNLSGKQLSLSEQLENLYQVLNSIKYKPMTLKELAIADLFAYQKFVLKYEKRLRKKPGEAMQYFMFRNARKNINNELLSRIDSISEGKDF